MHASVWARVRGCLLRLAAGILALSAVTAAPGFAAGERVALVIWNSNYEQVSRLPNPANDAPALAAALERLGFSVTLHEDQTVGGMRRALQDFEPVAAGAEIAVVYYAGHGIELGGTNYLIPVDAALKRDTHVEDEAISLQRVERAMEGASRLRLIMLDACRDNPFIAEMERGGAQRSIGRGLARVEPPPRTLIAYAAKGGTTAADGDGDHSPYAASLLKHIETPGLELNFLFRIVHDEVLEETDGTQEPFVYGSLGATEMYLKPADESEAAATASGASTSSASPSPSASATDEHLADADYFAAISENTEEAYRGFLRKHPRSPRTAQVTSLLGALAENNLWKDVADEDTISSYQRYLAAFGDGIYADEARTRMQRLIDDLRSVPTRGEDNLALIPTPTTPTPSDCGHPHGSYRVIDVPSNDVLWVRAQPDRDAAAVGSMPPNARGIGVGRCVNVAGYQSPWCEVRYECVSGWSYARYLSNTASSTAVSVPETYRVVGVPSNDVLNMRTGPGTSHGIVTGIPPNGTGIFVSGCQAVSGYSSKWCTVTWQGVSGWASSCCLVSERTGRKPN